MDGEISDSRIRVVERATGKILGTTVLRAAGDACKESVLEGSFTAGGSHVSLRGSEIDEYVRKFMH